jgi:hypothetical protein
MVMTPEPQHEVENPKIHRGGQEKVKKDYDSRKA